MCVSDLVTCDIVLAAMYVSELIGERSRPTYLYNTHDISVDIHMPCHTINMHNFATTDQ